MAVLGDEIHEQVLSRNRGQEMSDTEALVPDRRVTGVHGDDPAPIVEYEPPLVVDIGHVRGLTGGSSGSGSADANSQYYW
jgi:hypothetical protein